MKSKINRFFIPFVIFIFIFLFISLFYYGIEYGYDKEHEKSFFILASLFISSFVGALIFMPSHLEFCKDNNYNLPTAISNYILMMTESSIMFLGLYLTNENTVGGWYASIFYLLLFFFFGFHMFSYPRTLKESILMLAPNLLYVLSSLMNSKNIINDMFLTFAKMGYILLFSLVIAGFLMFLKPSIGLLKSDADKQLKTLFLIFSSLYLLFIFIPGILYLLPELKNYFMNESGYKLIISIVYFSYILYEKITKLTNELTDFISVK